MQSSSKSQNNRSKQTYNFTVDQLFPSENDSYEGQNSRLTFDTNTMFSGTIGNRDVNLLFFFFVV